jgi:hypothetical protein
VPKLIATEDPRADARRYLRHWANEDFVEGMLRERHPTIAADRVRRRRRQIAFAIEQGLEYLISAEGTSLLTGPLPLFYAAENFAKATSLAVDPAVSAGDFETHGLTRDRAKRYSIKNLCCTIASRQPSVWSRLFQTSNADLLVIRHSEDGQGLESDRRAHYATSAPPTGRQLHLGALLRHLPELEDDVVYANWGSPFVAHIPNYTLTVTTGPPRSETFVFQVDHGHHEPTKDMIIDRESDLLRHYTRQFDALNVLGYTTTGGHIGVPAMRLDVLGGVHMDFARGTLVLGEPVLYFAALFILSSVVRYDPEQWKRLTDDHPAEAILVERFLDVAARKLPNLILNELHARVFLFRASRAA